MLLEHLLVFPINKYPFNCMLQWTLSLPIIIKNKKKKKLNL